MKNIAGTGNGCPEPMDHHKDDGMERHGSPQAPIKIEERHPDRAVRWEYEQIDRVLMLPKRCLQSLVMEDGRSMDRIVVRDAGFKHHVFYFDVTDKLAAETNQIKDVIENLKKNRDKLSPEDRELLAAIEKDEKKFGPPRE